MADNVLIFDTTKAHAADTEYFVRRGMSKGYQIIHITVNRLLRATWVGGSVGIAGGGAVEYARTSVTDHEKLRQRRLVSAYNTSSLRADDHSTIGGILFAVIMPALFWKRANALNLILGGAGIGSAVGLLTHYARSLSGDTAPVIEIPVQQDPEEGTPPVVPPAL